ncbi:MAG: phosphodiester glycosidase family protein [Bacilli bacterium]|nr:phosphodiester glycosidase family protein [Bacilli bacterium]
MKKRLDIYKFTLILNLFLLPLLFSFFIAILNNYEKSSSIFKTITLIIILISLISFVISFGIMLKQNRIFNKNNIIKKIELLILILLYIVEIGFITNYVYFNKEFKNWLINTSLGSINHHNIAESIYSKYTIDDYIDNNDKIEEDLIDFNIEYNDNLYENKYEKEILEREENQLYKIIKIEGYTSASKSKYTGYLAVIYDPSHVKLAKSSGAGTFEGAYGETLATIANNNNALVAINAGGFYDPDWNSNGGIPHGDVFIDGKLDSTYVRGDFGGGLIGFTKENKLVLKRMSTESAIEMGIRDAVDWGPFLIVNGKNQFEKYISYFECARTVIGQREDGIVLFLVIDGFQKHSKGASYKDVADIMQKYGAVNAANLDGGTSTSMVENGKYINSPWNGFRPTFRWFPNAWIVVE